MLRIFKEILYVLEAMYSGFIIMMAIIIVSLSAIGEKLDYKNSVFIMLPYALLEAIKFFVINSKRKKNETNS